jgi:excinuclease UvrABC ATPase subunit
MKQFLPSHFEELKKKVLNKVGIKEISPSDCYRLAVDISNATHKQISETTMKRIYGFAVSRYKPSSFTLNAMADFCGYDGWSGFLSTMENQSVIDPQHRTWETVASTAHKITRFTLETNKQKSGIPFEYTIDRQQLHRHISAFEQKNHWYYPLD